MKHSKRQDTGKRSRGFTLIELMIVVAIVAVLAAIAIPSYRIYVQRTNRVDATASLLRLQNAQDRYYLQNNTYATTLAQLNFDSTTENDHYTLAISNANATGFTATATPLSESQSTDKDCQSFSINALGVKSATDSGGSDSSEECW